MVLPRLLRDIINIQPLITLVCSHYINQGMGALTDIRNKLHLFFRPLYRTLRRVLDGARKHALKGKGRSLRPPPPSPSPWPRILQAKKGTTTFSLPRLRFVSTHFFFLLVH